MNFLPNLCTNIYYDVGMSESVLILQESVISGRSKNSVPTLIFPSGQSSTKARMPYKAGPLTSCNFQQFHVHLGFDKLASEAQTIASFTGQPFSTLSTWRVAMHRVKKSKGGMHGTEEKENS